MTQEKTPQELTEEQRKWLNLCVQAGAAGAHEFPREKMHAIASRSRSTDDRDPEGMVHVALWEQETSRLLCIARLCRDGSPLLFKDITRNQSFIFAPMHSPT